MKRRLLLAMLTLSTLCIMAQNDVEYRAEVGGGVGMTSYHGDLGGGVFSNMKPGVSVIGKYRFNPRASLGLNISYGKIKGESDNTDTWYPELSDTTVSFSNTLIDASVKFEYNFWPYGTGREYRGAVRFTPYITVGLGFTHSDTPKGGVFAMQVPLGLGLKYKVATRLNLSLEWVMHFTTSDKLENVDEPYGIKSSGMFKNTDCYSVLQVSLTYDILAKCKVCNNDDF